MSTTISAGVDDCPCFSTFYYYDPLLIVKLQIFPYASSSICPKLCCFFLYNVVSKYQLESI